MIVITIVMRVAFSSMVVVSVLVVRMTMGGSMRCLDYGVLLSVTFRWLNRCNEY